MVKDDYLIAVDQNKTLEDTKQPSIGSAAVATIDFTKNKEEKKTFKSFAWTQPIQMLVWDEPYVIAVVNNNLEVRVLNAFDLNKDTFIQTMNDLPKVRLLVAAKRGILFAASINKLWCIESIEIPKQRNNLLQSKKFHLALQLTVSKNLKYFFFMNTVLFTENF